VQKPNERTVLPRPSAKPDAPPPEQAPLPPPGEQPAEKPERQLSIPPGVRLVEDLGAKPKDLVTLRKRLQKEFDISIPYKDYGQLRTVGLLIDYVEKAVQRKEEADKHRKSPQQVQPAQPQVQQRSFGIRPDGPPALGGVRPR
jgi:acyl carrier protein